MIRCSPAWPGYPTEPPVKDAVGVFTGKLEYCLMRRFSDDAKRLHAMERDHDDAAELRDAR
jgi:hypothetical protein